MKHIKEDEALQYFVHQIREQLGNHLKQIILFGSRALGVDVSGSDYDCLIIVDEVSKAIREFVDEVAGEALYQYNAVFSAFLISEEKRNKKPYNPLLINVGKERITL